MIKIAFSPIYIYALPEGHRFPMIKYELLPEQLLYEGTLTPSHFFEPPPIDDTIILQTHSAAYLDKLHTLSLSRKEERRIGFPLTAALVQRGKHIANGTLMCARFALKYGVSLNIAGGTHHAFPDHGEGFCVFNDFAIAANELLRTKEVRRILIVDLDVHQGNGTAHIFRNRSAVFTFSMHGARNYPIQKQVSDLDVALPDGTGDDAYLSRLRQYLPHLLISVAPDIVFYLSGVDVLATDQLGRLALSKEGCQARDRFIFEACRQKNVPVAVSMGGGYSKRIADVVEAHANTFREAIRTFS